MNDENLLEIDVPEKFKNPETGEVQIEMMAKSYKELESKLSQVPSAPKSHHEYCIDCSHGLFTADDEVNKRMHEKGFTPEQAQEVYDLAAEKMVPMIREIAADFQADKEVEKLVQHFGGAQKWQEVSRQLLAFGRQNMPEDVLDNMASSYEGVMALHRMMRGQEPGLQRQAAHVKDGVDEMKLNAMMRDPKYWKEKDPAFVAKVTKGFENLYSKA